MPPCLTRGAVACSAVHRRCGSQNVPLCHTFVLRSIDGLASDGAPAGHLWQRRRLALGAGWLRRARRLRLTMGASTSSPTKLNTSRDTPRGFFLPAEPLLELPPLAMVTTTSTQTSLLPDKCQRRSHLVSGNHSTLEPVAS